MNELLNIKRRFEVIGNSVLLDRCLMKASQVSQTEISVLITGESGTGKDIIPKIIHTKSIRKHGPFIAVNCGAIPEGTMDSELFGHEKGAFTGAINSRKGYFEEADNGTIFLDELGDMPTSTQARLLRVLENGEFIKVGSSKIKKTNVRVIAATNINLKEAVSLKKFREDLYYRLNTVEIKMPPLRKRKEDIHLLFKKFAINFAEKNNMPRISLNEEAINLLNNYNWPGNIRELKNFTEKISIIEEKRLLTEKDIEQHLPSQENSLIRGNTKNSQFSEREILYKVLFEMRNDINNLKEMLNSLSKNKEYEATIIDSVDQTEKNITENKKLREIEISNFNNQINSNNNNKEIFSESIEENLSLETQEMNIIKKALDKYNGKRSLASKELGISERTLYRKIKQYDL
jgi:transcriptional regulator with PAS, ATPase and Fis domain